MRQDLKIDAGLPPPGDARRAEIVEPLDDLATRAGTAAQLLQLGVLVMLFERDDVGLCRHSYPPLRLPPSRSARLWRAGITRQVDEFQHRAVGIMEIGARPVDDAA